MRALAYPSWLALPARRPLRGRVFAAFRRGAYLEVGDPSGGVVLALVQPAVGPGPLHVVVGGELPACPGQPAELVGNRLRVGDRTWELVEGAAWDATLPQDPPPVDAVRACADWLVSCGPENSLAPVLAHLLRGTGPPLAPWQARALQGARALRAGAFEAAGRLLWGLGVGFTPSGDDYLCGWMLAAHLRAVPVPPQLVHAPPTHRVSRACLQAAARGQASEAWHRFLAALHGGSWESEARAVAAAGATSGADTLAGFLAGLMCGAENQAAPNRVP